MRRISNFLRQNNVQNNDADGRGGDITQGTGHGPRPGNRLSTHWRRIRDSVFQTGPRQQPVANVTNVTPPGTAIGNTSVPVATSSTADRSETGAVKLQLNVTEDLLDDFNYLMLTDAQAQGSQDAIKEANATAKKQREQLDTAMSSMARNAKELPRPRYNLTVNLTQKGKSVADRPSESSQAQGSSPHITKEEYFAEWDEWAKHGMGREDRDGAVHSMKQWLNANDPERPLVLNGYELSDLPRLPATLQILKAPGNHLTQLKNLPPALKRLEVHDNRLTSLPEDMPDTLEHINASYNRLKSLPKKIPDKLRHLNVDNNQLKSLPEDMPDKLQTLRIARNPLDRLPKKMPADLRELDLSRTGVSSFPEKVLDGLRILDFSHCGFTTVPEGLPDTLQELTLTGNPLTSLENLPPKLKKLVVANTPLIRLPEHLPDELEALEAVGGQLASLPENLPRGITRLDIRHNMLSNLSDNLPPGLVHLDASHNQLTSTPENIPSGITSLDLSNNQLISLTEGITRLPEGGSVNLANNRLSEGVLNNLRAIVNAEDYRGPTFQFSVHGGGKKATRPLQHAVADWYGENAESVRTTWSDFEQEEGAKEFSLFLDVLIDTYLNKGEFRQEIREWLSHLANNPELRKNSFMLSFGATESCHDRVSIQYNDMKKARLIDDIEKGAYDERLSELIPIARGMFRLDKLEEIAREKYESLRLRDEIEVYLAYQVQLRDRLKLPLDTKMLFFSLSGVTGKDLEEAEKKVKKLENDEFIQYLSTQWGPWQSLLKRLNTEQQKKSEAELLNAVGGELADNVNARLKKEGLVGVLEAEVAFGVEEKKKIAHRINDKLTREFLQTQGIAHLLDEQWELETEDTGESSEAGGSKGKSRAE